MSNNTKLANPMKVITGKDTRWSYANVWEAKSINGGTPKFSVSLIIPKTDTVTVQKIKAATQAASPAQHLTFPQMRMKISYLKEVRTMNATIGNKSSSIKTVRIFVFIK